MNVEDYDARFNLVDAKTPVNEYLTAHYKQSLAFFTLHDRLPRIITEVIDNLSRCKDQIVEQLGEASREEVKTVIGQISELKYELQTDKELKALPEYTEELKKWNEFLLTLDNKKSYFSAVWLYAECYLYRRLKLIFEETETLKNYDYFKNQKDQTLEHCLQSIKAIGATLEEKKIDTEDEIRDYLFKVIKLNLWGNRCDLSVTAGKEVKVTLDPFAGLEGLDKFVLINQSSEIWDTLKAANGAADVQFINDNAGYELFTDVVLADYLIEHKLAKKITFNLKAIPWFISDALEHDVEYLFEFLKKTEDPALMRLSEKWKARFAAGEFTIHKPVDHFWTSAYEFCKMEKADPELYARLAKSDLLIFKGDLNYRKLLADFYWDPTTSFKDSLNGFLPTTLCSLRTVKADVISGLEKGKSEALTALDANWMKTGDYGVIQFAKK
ncbi:damage-control phosphatase ARMT1-like [Culicoides brevitarsis]|uniref:damage-control phosphatase ARMT1-like n=1 Tax=Culicoides brevitarsis TaxID=469753 RepID=UPI00307C67C8